LGKSTMSDTAGFNTDVSFRGQHYHVQTENVGEASRPTICTLIFLDGALVHKTSSQLEPAPEPDQLATAVAERIRQQHTAALNRVRNGDYASR